MIFASTPATGSATHKGPGRYLAAGSGWGRTHAPNPILLRIREDDERSRRLASGIALSGRVDMWLASIGAIAAFGGFVSWDSPRHPRHVLTVASAEEIDHARRVLERLIA